MQIHVVYYLLALVLVLSTVLLQVNAEFTEMDRPKVLVTNIDVPKVGLDLLSSKYTLPTYYLSVLFVNKLYFRCNVTIVQKNDDKNEVLTKVRGVDGIYWASHMRLDKDIIDAAGKTF